MNYIKIEIDDDVPGNKEKTKRWEKKYGSVDSHIDKQECQQCGEKTGGTIYYVCCYNGQLRWWHAFLCTSKVYRKK